ELVGASPASQIAELQAARSAALQEIADLEARWIQFWNAASRGARIRELQDAVKEIDALIRELEGGWSADLETRIEELLGVTQRGLQGAVAGAFSASTAEDFTANIEGALTSRVRNAFVTAFLESATMAPLFERLGDAIREALVDVDISPDEMRGIRAIMDEIRDRSTPLYDLLDEMGLLADTTERLNTQFERLVNVPLGFRALQALRFEAATPAMVPMFQGAGLYGGGVGGGGVAITGPINVSPRAVHDVRRPMAQYRRERGVGTAGNAMRGRRG